MFDELGKILFIIAKIQPELSYSQGMNEVVGLLFYVVNEHRVKTNLIVPFALFKAIAQRVRYFWRFNDEGIKCWLTKISTRLDKVDSSVAKKLDAQGISPALYAIPWIVTLFVQTFELWIVIQLWDYLLAGESLAEEVELVSVSLVLLRRETILSQHYNEIIKSLQNMKELEMPELVRMCQDVRSRRKGLLPLGELLRGFQRLI